MTAKKASKRVPKNKPELIQELKDNQRKDKQRKILRAITALRKDISVRDFTDHVEVFAGLVTVAVKERNNKLTVGELTLDLSPKAAPYPDLLQNIFDIVKDETSPDDIAALLTQWTDHVEYQVKEVACIDKKVEDLDVDLMLK